MKRTIKFRGKRIDNGEWVYGSLINNAFDESAYIFTIEHDENFDCWEDIREVNFFEVDPETVGQYTGLRDKNVVEICIGDILATSNDNADLDIWDEFFYGYTLVKEKEGQLGIAFSNWVVENSEKESVYDMAFVIVVGNLFDNPDLLEVKDDVL